MKFNDLIGQKFGRLTVISRAETKKKRTRWLCKCDCGRLKEIVAYNLTCKNPQKNIKSCGCLFNEYIKTRSDEAHPNRMANKMLWNSKKRAKEKGLEFNISVEDILIPDKCPLLGIPMYVQGKKQTQNSPSLDRIDSTKGYVKGNVMVISMMANTMKHVATFEQFETMYLNWKKLNELS